MKFAKKGMMNFTALFKVIGIVIAVALIGPIGLLIFASIASATFVPALDSLHGLAGNLTAKGGLFSTLTGILIDPYGVGGIVAILVLLSILAVVIFVLFAGFKGLKGIGSSK